MGCEWLGHAALLCRLHMRPLIRGRHGCGSHCDKPFRGSLVAKMHQTRLQKYKDFIFRQHYWGRKVFIYSNFFDLSIKSSLHKQALLTK